MTPSDNCAAVDAAFDDPVAVMATGDVTNSARQGEQDIAFDLEDSLDVGDELREDEANGTGSGKCRSTVSVVLRDMNCRLDDTSLQIRQDCVQRTCVQAPQPRTGASNSLLLGAWVTVQMEL